MDDDPSLSPYQQSKAKQRAEATALVQQVSGKPKRNAKGQLLPGYSGNPLGGYSRARRELNHQTIVEMQRAFARGGANAVNKVMRTNPAMFLKLLVLLVPREMQIEHSGGIKALNDEQLERTLEVLREAIERREAGANAKLIQGVSEPIVTPVLPRRKTKRKEP